MTNKPIDCVATDIGLSRPPWDRVARAVDPARIVEVGSGDPVPLRDRLEQADVAILEAVTPSDIPLRSRLGWIHVNRAGLDTLAKPDLIDNGPQITGSAGRSAPALAEHALFFMLSLAYQVPGLIDAQRARHWGVLGEKKSLRALCGRTVGIVGLGHTGRALATRVRALGMRVMGYRRTEVVPEGVDVLFCAARGETIAPLLSESDFLVLALPLTDQTHRMIGASELAAMKAGAFLINLARGAIVDEEAMVASLQSGHLGGAGLDVFGREPLPWDSLLWTAPNTLITPHFTPRVSDRGERTVDIILENIERYRRGAPLLNRLTRDDVFTGALAPRAVPFRPGYKSPS